MMNIQTNEALPWHKRMRRLEFRPPYADEERLVGYLKDMGADSFMTSAVDAHTGFSLYPSKMTPMCKLVDGEYMNRLLKLCHESGIMAVSWYGPRENSVLWHEKPEWRMLVKENNDVPAHEARDILCYISSPYREWVCEHLEEIVRELDFDGVFFDMSTIGGYETSFGCYCESCKRNFLKDTGYEIPEKIEWGTPVTDRFVQWRYDKYWGWLTEVRDRLRAIRRDLVIELNVLNRPHVREAGKAFNWRSGIELRTLPEGIGAGSESDASIYRTCSMNQAAAHARAMNPQHWNLWMPALFGSFDERAGMYLADEAPPAETFRLLVAEAVSKGGVAWYGVDLLTRARRERLKDAFDFVREREPHIGDVLVRDVAIHMSNSAKDHYGKHDAEDYLAGVLGLFEAVTELHCPVDYVLDDQLTEENLGHYRVLILSNSACLSAGQVESIGAFVKNGGTLVATHFTSLLDENGKNMENFALSELFGVDFGGVADIEKGSGILRLAGREAAGGEVSILKNASFIDMKIPEGSSAKAIATMRLYDCEFIPYFRAAVKNLDYDDLEIDDYFEIPAGTDLKPAIVQNVYGKGRVFYCGFDLGGVYLKKPCPGTRRIIESFVAGEDAPIRMRAPKAIEFSALESADGKKLYLHAVNAPATTAKSPGWHTLACVVDEVLPVYGVTAEIRGRAVAGAVNALTGEPCGIEREGDCVRIRFDCRELHEIILVE